MEEWSPVTVATGALGPVLAKLTALLGDEFKLLEESRSDIESIKAALEQLLSLLLSTWERKYPDAVCRPWMTVAQELSYDVDEHINDFISSLEHGFVQQVNNRGHFFRDLKMQCDGLVRYSSPLKDFLDQNQCWPLETIPTRKKPNEDPRARFLGDDKDAWELVGVDEQKEELIKILVGANKDGGGSVQEHRIVCIHGFAGMGKTTLADLVYQEIGEQFQCRAFVSLPPTPRKTGVLYSVLREIRNGEPSAATREADDPHLINDISNFLAGKRYLIVIDDIWYWQDWELIISSLPKSYTGSRIMMTTRSTAIAEKCRADNNAFVYKIMGLSMDASVTLSQRIIHSSKKASIDEHVEYMTCCSIADMSAGMPLAVIGMSLAVAGFDDRHYYHYYPIYNQLDAVLREFRNIQCLEPLMESLWLGYIILPLHLKTCLLHCSIHHKNDWVERDQLTRIWIAEGFVHGVEKAQSYFDELVNWGLIRRCSNSRSRTLWMVGCREIPSYEIDTLMLQFLICKSEENNLVTLWGRNGSELSSSNRRRIRRLTIPGYQDSMDVSHTRSLVVFNSTSDNTRIPFNKFERLQVLDLSYYSLQSSDLVEICELLWLRHLGLKGTSISELPREIGRLHRLEVLDVRYTEVRELPWEVGQVSKYLRVLAGDKDSTDGVKLPEGVGSTWKDEALSSSWLEKCSRPFLSVTLFDRIHFSWEPVPVAGCKVGTRNTNLQQWVKQHLSDVPSLDIRIRELEEDDLKFLREMPNLQVLALTFDLLQRKPVAVSGAGFSSLESLFVDSRLPRVTFQPGAMPKLKHIEFKFHAGLACDDDPTVGITHLCSLQKVVFQSSRWHRSDAPGISTTIAAVRKEAEEHRNRITLCINGNEEVLPAMKTSE